MVYLVAIAVLLIFCLISYRTGYKRGADWVIMEWRTWIEDTGGK